VPVPGSELVQRFKSSTTHATPGHQEERKDRSGTSAGRAGRRGRIEEKCERYSKRSTG